MHEGLVQANLVTRLLPNDDVVADDYPAALRQIISLAEHRRARDIITSWPGYQATKLHTLDRVATDLGLGTVWLKDESTRFGLGAFKSVGGAYAVYRVLEQRIRERHPNADVSPAVLIAGAHSDISSNITFACASAGNHGRAVAWGAQLFGARCVVYLYQGVSAGRRAAIESLGAIVDTTAPDYDYAVRKISQDAHRNGWLVISDTAYGNYRDVPRLVMQGYTVIAQEVLEQLGDRRPTHVLLQAGVGGFAAAIAAHIWESLGSQRPRFLVVEPEGAACVRECMAHGRFSALASSQSIMGGLNCAAASTIAWEILQQAADWSVTISDDESIAAMRKLGSIGITAGESGAAGFAALNSLAGDPAARAAVGFDQNARVLLFSTEGATDPATYHALTGLDSSARDRDERARSELHA
jgi:diaminopropionate ammonia-lyase